MNILLVGIGKDNYNYRKIEGFYNAFLKLGTVEWVQNIFEATSREYDICFGETDLHDLFNQKYSEFFIKKQVLWCVYQPSKLIDLAIKYPNTVFVNLYKSDILNENLTSKYIESFGNLYQICPPHGIDFTTFKKDLKNLPNNLLLDYLPCCLSETTEFHRDKLYDICYFGTMHNRPIVSNILNKLQNKYKILMHNANGSPMNPNECFSLYKQCKIAISEQVDSVALELPVRLGEATANGCKMFILEKIPVNQKHRFIPHYESCFTENEMISKIENYLDNFKLEDLEIIHKNFNQTYDNAVEFILNKLR